MSPNALNVRAAESAQTTPADGISPNGVAPSGVTARVVILCLLLAVCFGYIIPLIDVKLYNTFLGSTHLPPGAIAVLLILALVVNPVLHLLSRLTGQSRRGRGFAFSRNEALTIYICGLFSALVPGHGSASLSVTQIIGSFYYATRENRWLDFLQPYLKPWLTPALTRDGVYRPQPIEAWYVGLGTQAEAIPWGAWLVPLGVWASLLFATYLMLGCLGVMLRAQWAEREALSFPLLRLPLELTEDMDRSDPPVSPLGKGGSKGGGRFFRDPRMWLGFTVAVFLHMLNGLNLYFPDVPPLPLEIPTAPLFTEPPWNQIGPAPIVISPIAVGITFLLASDVSFSLWFFFWFFKVQLMLAYQLGFVPNALPTAIGFGVTKSFASYQIIGAYFVYAGLVLWTAREHLQHVARRALGLARATGDERHEALSYPAAFWGFVLSFAFIIAWSVAAGIAWHVALALWLCYLVMALGLTRLVAESGLLFASQGWTPLGAMAQIFNSGPGTWLAPSSIVPAAFVQASLMTDNRSLLLPGFIHGFKLARDHHINARPLWALIYAVILITLAMTMWMRVRMGYEYGGLQLNNKWVTGGGAQLPVSNIILLAEGAREVNWMNALWLACGGAMTYTLMWARGHFLWFPFHPLGLLMCLSYPSQRLWMSIFLGWLCKVLILRFGGSDTYRKAIPAFLGLVLGEVAMVLFWLVIDGWQGRTGHQLMAG